MTTTFDIDRVVEKYGLATPEIEILRELTIDQSQQEAISNFDQRTPEWLRARQNRITASRFGAARGHCPYTSKRELLKSLLWADTIKSNAAMEYGVRNEEVAVSVYSTFMRKQFNLHDDQFRVTHCGLLVPLAFPWAGVSVDGFVFDDSQPEGRKRGALECKCPYGKLLYPYIPSMYYDQIQGSMGFLGIPWWDFVVWTPQQTQIRRVEFDKEYFDQELFPRIETFYMTEYLPRAVLKRQGLLQPGKIDRTYTLFISEQPHDEEISQEPESAPPRLDWFTVKHTETETTNVTTYADDTFNKSTVQQQQQQ